MCCDSYILIETDSKLAMCFKPQLYHIYLFGQEFNLPGEELLAVTDISKTWAEDTLRVNWQRAIQTNVVMLY